MDEVKTDIKNERQAARAWTFLLLGGLLEIGWALGLKFSNGLTEWLPVLFLILLIPLSFYLFTVALQHISIGTGYAVFAGIGSAGTAVAGILFLNETIHPAKFVFLCLLIIGIIGVKGTEGANR